MVVRTGWWGKSVVLCFEAIGLRVWNTLRRNQIKLGYAAANSKSKQKVWLSKCSAYYEYLKKWLNLIMPKWLYRILVVQKPWFVSVMTFCYNINLKRKTYEINLFTRENKIKLRKKFIKASLLKFIVKKFNQETVLVLLIHI